MDSHAIASNGSFFNPTHLIFQASTEPALNLVLPLAMAQARMFLPCSISDRYSDRNVPPHSVSIPHQL
jgi:hypothetical protein